MTLLPGMQVNDRLKSICTKDVTVFRRRPELPDGLPGSSCIRVSTEESAAPVLLYRQCDAVLWYPAAGEVYLNPDSSHLFEGLETPESGTFRL